ncbi:uncharacterized protein LOC106154215 [Lingula anatina]|uniref:Uncharacterized protein LOC106154215 n=1 Tax=Lingula anatina TaxID=7574 RepID=A0A1S3HEK7_LINAN|nr:uncharacterized protein LOC106154215 [Lingula anatina]|eukprot:XP_013383941.1 uncharacterized protein LOC106154215 [Lingula anatina]
MATSSPQRDRYHFTVLYDGCFSGEEDTNSVKLSYKFVKDLQEEGERRGIHCHLPHSRIKPGEIEASEIYSAVENSNHVIMVMTDEYLRKVRENKKKHLDESEKDPNSMLLHIHYNILNYKIKNNTDGIFIIPIYLQTQKEEISLGSYKCIRLSNKDAWEDNWEKIWNIIPEDIQPSVLIGSAVSSPGSSVPDAGESDGPADSGTVLEYMSVSEMEGYCSNNSLGKSRFGEVFKAYIQHCKQYK